MTDHRRICAIEDVPADSTLLFRIRDGAADRGEREAILARTADGVVAWLNSCRHYTHIRLDKGRGATMRDGELICQNHGAMYDVGTGRCTHGPCEGAILEPIEVSVEDGDVYLTDPDVALVGTGTKSGDDHDLTSTSNVEF